MSESPNDADPAIEVEQPAKARHPIFLVLKIAVTLGLVALLVSKIDIAAVTARVANADPAWLAAAVALLAAQLVASGLRWRRIALRLGLPMTRRMAVRLAMVGQFFSQAMPAAIGGDVVRAWLASRESGNLGASVSSVLSDRAIAFVVLLLTASVGQVLASSLVSDSRALEALRLFVWALTAIAIAGLALGPIVVAPLAKFKFGARLRRVLADARSIVSPPWNKAAATGLISVFVQLSLVACAFCIARALALPLTFMGCLVMIPPVLITTIIPVSIGGWGVRESAMVVGLGMLGVQSDGALALSILYGLGNLVIAVPGGIVWVATHGLQPARSGP
ncbi:lysylphosphatidylglycerol synthase transmembrane domain-containing protein [Usitatibacter palustris]|uniref:Lysylphosphatidylglycerol synthase TM region n=1 Tax=Usitatibacter palustris TaxID=2732487 RepID=A0A6M4HA68_9PROT|nr:lysylphosphatidylglycerol synthase transmembrane domain-containing protein [Usitatibacter palustris]QJR16510.1 hypothetical protein DSM104440_03345 [Usitatibacter palustris]